MLNGLKIEKGQQVIFTMFTDWTYTQGQTYVVEDVGAMDDDGWFDIKIDGKRDWTTCLHFSLK